MGEFKDKITGNANDAAGSLKQKSGDDETQAEGFVQELKGKAQKLKGEAKGVVDKLKGKIDDAT